MRRVPEVYAECQDVFEETFGRRPPDAVVPYRMDDAEIAVVSMGTTDSTVLRTVDQARSQGQRVGSLRVRMFRPFPERELTSTLARCGRVAILDRDISLGLGGVLWSEARCTAPRDALVQNYVLGLGGGDIQPEHIGAVLEDLRARDTAGAPEMTSTSASLPGSRLPTRWSMPAVTAGLASGTACASHSFDKLSLSILLKITIICLKCHAPAAVT